MEKKKISADPLREKTLDFAVRIVKFGNYLRNSKQEYIISKQIIRCGTNPGAMVREAANAESGMDFIHKLAIAQKEIGETEYWLEVLLKSETIH
jgi:four helix bundle protein